MMKAATIFLLVLLVSVQTPVGQLLKFPLLIEHFIKHQKKDKVSLPDFLADHYTRDHRDADFPEDEQLPFKNITFHSIGFAIMTPAVQPTVAAQAPSEKKVMIPDTHTPQQHLARIFHPPRV